MTEEQKKFAFGFATALTIKELLKGQFKDPIAAAILFTDNIATSQFLEEGLSLFNDAIAAYEKVKTSQEKKGILTVIK